MPVTYNTESERVAAGARLMDKILPGWHKQVNLDKLNMRSGAMCLLGQTFGVHTEKCLAREMYPEEWLAAREESGVSSSYGYSIATDMLYPVVCKLGLTSDIDNSELRALRSVCTGARDTKCEWAAEVADRLAKDEEANGKSVDQ